MILTIEQAAAVAALADAALQMDATITLVNETSHVLIRIRKDGSVHLAQFFDTGDGKDRTEDYPTTIRLLAAAQA